jgi:LPPG:FO 2-phospho-L-lactate transferase
MVTPSRDIVVALCGGVGGAKLASGLQEAVAADCLTVVVNTGDDFQHLGLRISPDIDSVVYAMSGRNDAERGWGRANESWNFMSSLREIGAETWFQLGDRDLAMHVARTAWINGGGTLSVFTQAVTERFGIKATVLPMTDDTVSTGVWTAKGLMEFQRYFVEHRCEPVVQRIEFVGAATAAAQPDFVDLLSNPRLRAVVLCPSNPYLSIDPILALPGVRQMLADCAPVVAVSPLVGGRALKGPAAKIMTELGVPLTPDAIVAHYDGLLDGIVLDESDAANADCGVASLVAPTIMRNADDRRQLASVVLDFADRLATAPTAGRSGNV